MDTNTKTRYASYEMYRVFKNCPLEHDPKDESVFLFAFYVLKCGSSRGSIQLFGCIHKSCEIVQGYVIISCEDGEMVHGKLPLAAFVELVLLSGNA